jgi:serine phosphatase RsbU (regulator of sigma subunit)/anti-sigma regulatory factor (Ser/Thr protein kinase)/anti-anti-sigma regulatory factor
MREPAEDDQLSSRVGNADTVRRVFDALPVMVIALEGPELRISAINSACRALAGRSKAIGVPLAEAFAEVAGQQTLEMYDHVYATGETITQRAFRVQLEPEDTDERIEVFIDVTLQPTRAEDGAITGVLGLITDVTDRVKEQQAAQQRAVEAEYGYAQARDVIDALQRELLPPGVPVLPALQIAAGYLLADADTAAGGDWFDALALPDGRVGLVVGDVVGHGVSASAVMGQLRVLLHEWLLDAGDITIALEAVDRFAARVPGARAATACVVLLDPGSGTLEYCTAGHPPALVLSAEGESRYLPATGAGPLGVPGNRFTTATDRLDERDLLLLYTDGILERPGRDLAGATVELARTAADVAADRALREPDSVPAERVVTQTLELLTRVTGHTDDITLLAAQRVAPREAFTMRAPATLSALPEVRRELGDWLAAGHFGPQATTVLNHAVGELVTNAMEHAYLDSAGPHPVTITAEIGPTGQLTARTVDEGRWREPKPSADRGLGLGMTSDLVDSLHLDHDDSGTTATLTYRLSRPARLMTDRTLTSRPTPAAGLHTELFLVLDQPSAPRPRVRVDGPVDASTVASFHYGIRTAASAGTRSLTVDLTGVTHLASAGVAALHRLVDGSRANGTELRLYAPAGSPAAIIMTLVRLPHTTTDPDHPDH